MRRILGCALFLMLFSVFAPCHALSAQAGLLAGEQVKTTHDFGENNPDVVLCMGDSITEGVGYNVPPSETYPARLQEFSGKTVINTGLGGARSSYGVARIRTFLNRFKPGYVTILFGVNDIGYTELPVILDNLRTMAWESKNNMSVPVVATLTPVFGPRGWKARQVVALNEMIREMALADEILLADLELAFDWDPSFFPDGLHPNSAGMEIIARTFAEVIEAFETHDPSSEGGGGSGGCVLHPKAGFSVDLLFLFLACVAVCLARFLKGTSRPSA